MLDQLVESIIPGGFYIGVGVALGATFSERLRPVAKEMLKYGMTAAERIQEATAEAYERSQDLVAEARHEQQQEARGSARPAAPPRRSRSTSARRAAASRTSPRRRATVAIAPRSDGSDGS